jgi:outer membrane lipoprotein SlyB
MLIKIISFGLVSVLVFSGCATNEGPSYDGSSYQEIKRVEIGSVLATKAVVIEDSGNGAFLGTVIGAVLGSTLGGGNGQILTSLGGGIAGYYAGEELSKANGEELTVRLENGETVIVVIKGNHINTGDKVKIIKDGNKVAQVDVIK